MLKLKEMMKEFFYTTEEQMYDEWRELKSFIMGMLVVSIIWAMAWVIVK